MKSYTDTKYWFLFVGIVCASCGGGGTSSEQTESPDETFNTGAVVVENNSSKQYIDETGNLTDISAENTTVITDGLKGFSFGFGTVLSNEYDEDAVLAEDDDVSYMGVAAIHTDSDVGAAVTASQFSFNGTYELQYQQTDALGELGDLHDANGQLTIDVDLNAGTGTISDDFMSGSAQASAGSELTIGDGTISGQDFEIEVSYEGADGYLEGIFGTDGLVGAMSGVGSDGFFVGGAIANPE